MINLNLIPPRTKDEIKRSARFRAALRWELELSGIIIIFISLLLSVNYIVKLNLASVESSVGGNSEKIEKLSELDEKIKEINLTIGESLRARNGQLRWEFFFQKLNENYSEKVKIEKINTENYTIALSGIAATREDLIKFKEDLAQEPCFSDVDLPLSSLVTKENADFRLSLKIKKECLIYDVII